MPTRVAVFFDWMNVYKQARTAFGLQGRGVDGQIEPLKLARLLAAGNKRRGDGQLVRVEVHRGQPIPSQDRVGELAVTLQAQAWEAAGPPGLVKAQLRPLRYEPGMPPQEKGVDVLLASHAVEWAALGKADVVIVVSHDSDLRAVVEAIARISGPTHVETASWKSDSYHKRIAPVAGVVNHTMRRALYDGVADPTGYGAMARARIAARSAP
jgi:uncharacterized LabA/DUF88 family protein